MAFVSQNIIPAEIRYKIYDGKFLAIVEIFNIWKYYLKGSQHKFLVLINHNNFCWFMDTKSLSFKQVCWAQKLSCYYFWIDYY